MGNTRRSNKLTTKSLRPCGLTIRQNNPIHQCIRIQAERIAISMKTIVNIELDLRYPTITMKHLQRAAFLGYVLRTEANGRESIKMKFSMDTSCGGMSSASRRRLPEHRVPKDTNHRIITQTTGRVWISCSSLE